MEKDLRLQGQMLVAAPSLRDSNFARSVVYMCAHSAEGALGLIVNRSFPDLCLGDILERFAIPCGGLKERREMAVRLGGPVETSRGFVVHRTGVADSSKGEIAIDGDIVMTGSLEILKEVARGGKEEDFFLALGYAGWGAGQLEHEIQENGWLHCESDSNLLFGFGDEEKYAMALEKIGVSEESFSDTAGHS